MAAQTTLNPGTGAARLSTDRFGLGPFRLAAELIGFMLVVASGLRLVLFAGHVGLSDLTATQVAQVAFTGLRFDLLISLICAAPLVFGLMAAGPRAAGRFSRWMIEAYWSLVFVVMPFLCVIEVLFFREFDSRLNYIAFEYLVYPTEVCCNIQQSYPAGTILTVVGLIALTFCLTLRNRGLRLLERPMSGRMRFGFPAALLASLAALGLTCDATDMQLTSNRVANECAGNGVFSFFYHAWTCRFEFDRLYVTIDPAEARTRLRHRVAGPEDHFEENAPHPLDRLVDDARPSRDLNVVLILEESLGADHVGILGGEKLTPNFDALCEDGVLFDNFYATGNRTARALEAVLTSLPPIPTESILKRDHSQHVYTLANVLEQRGYERLFMTGGRGVFDGVRSFMTANGFNHFRELSDYRDPVFTNAWGVADEDLFRNALVEMDALAETGKPFFSMLLTVSNHQPFTYPDGRIDRPSSAQSRDNAVMYADWALGDFFRKAKAKPWYENTVFLVMGDHGARVYGRQLFPIRSYRVPMLMIAPGILEAGARCHTLGGSMDIAPTIAGMLHGDYASVFFGRDLRAIDPDHGYALMQHNHSVAVLDARHHLTVLESGRGMAEYLVTAKHELRDTGLPESDAALDAAAFYQTAYEMYYGDKCYPARLGSPAPRTMARTGPTAAQLAARK